MTHHSAFAKLYQWLAECSTEEIFHPEVDEVMRKVTGAKQIIIGNSAIRNQLANEQVDPTNYEKRGSEMDKPLKKMPRDGPRGQSSLPLDSLLEPLPVAD